MKYMNQTEYAQHRGISQQRVSQLIRDGYLKGALKSFGRRKLIHPTKADKLLGENQSLIHRKKGPTPGQLDAQEEATDYASIENADGDALPWPWWPLRYLIKLQELDPNQTQITQHSDTQFTIKTADLDPDGGEPSPWELYLEFSFGSEHPSGKE